MQNWIFNQNFFCPSKLFCCLAKQTRIFSMVSGHNCSTVVKYRQFSSEVTFNIPLYYETFGIVYESDENGFDNLQRALPHGQCCEASKAPIQISQVILLAGKHSYLS